MFKRFWPTRPDQTSICLDRANIAEGHGRKRNQEFANFLNIARGSANEVQSHLHIAVGLGYLAKDDFEKLYASISEISKMTFSLAKYLRGKAA
ncbi:MAG: four helix bundle protein [Pyrinomonadaceae bacterium]|nr:four helix bundle protein [Pyrinomonadaceae bacterium]